MATIDRIRCVWAGFPGAPGVSTFYSLDAAADVGTLHGFFQNIKPYLPIDVTISVPTTGDQIDTVNGDLTGGWSGGSGGDSTGEVDSVYSAPSGALIVWDTGVVADGHRVRGRTYVVPLAGSMYQGDGSIGDTCKAALDGAAGSLLTGTLFQVWHRPRLARAATSTRKALEAHIGTNVAINGHHVPDKAVVLRSRRD